MAVPNLKLNSGHEMPQVGFGLWKVANDVCADTVYNAIKAGYRLFDGACGMLALSSSARMRCQCQVVVSFLPFTPPNLFYSPSYPSPP